jgi:hypothetical protein
MNKVLSSSYNCDADAENEYECERDEVYLERMFDLSVFGSFSSSFNTSSTVFDWTRRMSVKISCRIVVKRYCLISCVIKILSSSNIVVICEREQSSKIEKKSIQVKELFARTIKQMERNEMYYWEREREENLCDWVEFETIEFTSRTSSCFIDSTVILSFCNSSILFNKRWLVSTSSVFNYKHTKPRAILCMLEKRLNWH